MPSAATHQSATIQKHLFIGDSGTGKTTSLLSLVKSGYNLRIYDYDSLLDPLIAKCRLECPERLDQIEFMSFRDTMRATPSGPIIAGVPRAFVDGLKAFDTWEDGSKPYQWGANYIAVIDSFTTLSRAAYFWARGLQGGAGIPEGVATKGIDNRAVFYTAQQALMNLVAQLCGTDLISPVAFNTNLIVIAHIKYMEQDGQTKGFPVSVGSAISPEIPTYFPSVTLCTKKGETRVLRTRSTNMIDLKNPRSFEPAFATELPIETGWATLFQRNQ